MVTWRRTYITVKNHSKRENPLLAFHGFLFPINNKSCFCLFFCFFFAPSHSQDNTNHGFCNTCWLLAGNRSVDPPSRIDPTTHHTMSRCSMTRFLFVQYHEWVNECLTTPQHKIKSAVGCHTNGNLKANTYISKLNIHKVIKYSVKSCTIGCHTNGNFKANMYISKLKIHKVIKSCTIPTYQLWWFKMYSVITWQSMHSSVIYYSGLQFSARDCTLNIH